MGDDEQYQEFNVVYESRKKKNRKKNKFKPFVNLNAEDTQSEDSNVDANAAASGCDEEESLPAASGPVAFDGLRQVGDSWIPIAEQNFLSSSSSNKVEDLELHDKERLEPFNEKALSRFASTYELEKYEKNALIIFNQKDIDDDPRYGTMTDADALTKTFERFNFEVTEHCDKTKEEIFQLLEKFVNEDYTDYGCIGVAVLTHGSRYGRLRAKDVVYNEIEIINHLKTYNKPTLVTKPKFLIIQACRGTKIKPAVPVFHSAKLRTDTDTDLEPYHLPEEADLLILHSCYVGTPALRHEINGSWFIQSLCQKIGQLAATHDLESIITEVKRVVAIDRFHLERDTLPVQICQMPVMTSTLIRKLYLKKYGDPPPADSGLVIPFAGPELAPPTRKDSLMDPTTPLLPQFGPCYCFLEHFNYMRDCLRYFVEDNPDDVTGRLHLDLANELEDKVFNMAKQKMLRIIHDHLKMKAKDFDYFKYMYLSNHV